MTHLPLICALFTTITVGLIDYRTGRMPNSITISSVVGALLLRSIFEGLPGLCAAGLGAGVVGGIPFLLFFTTRGRAIGGGDVKALFALGAWLGPAQGLEASLLSFFLLSGYALALMAWRGQLGALVLRCLGLLLPSSDKRRQALATNPAEPSIPAVSSPGHLVLRFGPALALGTSISCVATWLEEVSWLSLLV
jgi:Flp pilus assembly protein protease CpaA